MPCAKLLVHCLTVAAAIGGVAAAGDSAHAGFSLKCGQPILPGEISIKVHVSQVTIGGFFRLDRRFTTDIPGFEGPATKCAQIAAAANAAFPSLMAVASNDRVTFEGTSSDFIDGVSVTFDTTAEANEVDTILPSGQKVRLSEYFADLTAISHKGEPFFVSFTKNGVTTSFTIYGNGIQTAGDLIKELDQSILADTGWDFAKPIYEAGGLVGLSTQPIDPTSVEISWTGAMGYSVGDGRAYPGLANFGIEISAGVPEASTWAMLALGFGGLGLVGLWRRQAERQASARGVAAHSECGEGTQAHPAAPAVTPPAAPLCAGPRSGDPKLRDSAGRGAFMTGLANGKNGLLDRMSLAAKDADRLARAGEPVLAYAGDPPALPGRQ
jgi:hypothetical protein